MIFPLRKIGIAGLILAIWLIATTAAGAAQIHDEIGRVVSAPDNPQRIIALTPSLTEILFALGLADKVVGVTDWTDFPPETTKLPRIGVYVSPNMERIVELAPDLVLVNREGNPPWVVDKLEEAGIPVYVTRPDDPLDLPDSFERLGALCGAPEAGRRLADDLRQTMKFVSERLKEAKPISTLMVIGSDPLVSVGGDTFLGRLLDLVKADNIAKAAGERWPRLSMEFMVVSRPRLVLLSMNEKIEGAVQSTGYWRSLLGLDGDPDFRVASINADLLHRPGPRLAEGIKRLAVIIHPEAFPEGTSVP